jgi:hypothetical protein
MRSVCSCALRDRRFAASLRDASQGRRGFARRAAMPAFSLRERNRVQWYIF